MGKLIDGVWQEDVPGAAKNGSFQRDSSSFREQIGGEKYPAEPGRYRLYVSYACPWAHRTIIVRALKGLEAALPMTVVDAYMGPPGWSFSQPEESLGASHLYELYQRASGVYTGRVTVPILWDTRENTIVNNESSEVIRILNRAFDAFSTRKIGDLYPDSLQDEINGWNARVYDTVNNGVYKAGFATKQDAYAHAVGELFATLDVLETHLATRDFLVGDRLTEADIRLFTTLVRFDAVYHGHFKCNVRRLIDYRHLSAFAKRLYEMPGVAETVRFDHIKEHYYRSHPHINPSGVVPVGPGRDFRDGDT